MSRSPREVAELVRRMVEGKEGIEFPDLFAEHGVMEYPFSVPGMPLELKGREEIRAFFDARKEMRRNFEMREVTAEVFDTDDPEVVITVIKHNGISKVINGPYTMEALGIIRVRGGEIVHYRDYMNPLKLAELTGRMPHLIEAVTAAGTGAGQ